MAEQELQRVLDGMGLLHAEVRQVHGELRALRAELQQVREALHEAREETRGLLSACDALREGQRALEAQSALGADALRLVAGVVQRLAEVPGGAG